MNTLEAYWKSLSDEDKLQYLIEYSETNKIGAMLRFAREMKEYYEPSAYELIVFFKKKMIWLNGPTND